VAGVSRANHPLIGSREAAISLAALAVFIFYGSSGAWVAGTSRAEALPGISLPDLIQNFLLYVPFGVLAVWTYRGFQALRPAVILWAAASAFIYGSTMELLQTLFTSRIASPLDVLANVGGAFAGAVAATRTERLLERAVELARRTGLLTSRARYALLPMLAAMLVTAWYPFDVTLDISTLGERSRPVRIDYWLRPSTPALWIHGAQFFVLATTLTFCLHRLSRRAAPVLAVVSMMLFAVVVDLGQLAMGSQPVGVAAFVSQSAGACAGAVAALSVTLARDTWYAAA
jgi:VanZ family protein